MKIFIFYLTYWYSHLISFLFFPTKVYGRENLPKDGNCIVACNHVSNLDPVVMGIIFPPFTLNFMAKDSLFNGSLMGWWLRCLGAFPVKRDEKDFGAIKQALKNLQKGRSLILFPEGTRGSFDRDKKPQPGVGLIALKSQKPVVPAYISGTEKAMPPGKKLFRRHQVTVIFGKPQIFTTKEEYSVIAEQILANIYALSRNALESK